MRSVKGIDDTASAWIVVFTQKMLNVQRPRFSFREDVLESLCGKLCVQLSLSIEHIEDRKGYNCIKHQ